MTAAPQIGMAAALGAVIGSFLNVVIHRMPLRLSIVHPGSHCPSCERPIAAYDNVPVVSWLLLRGRCRRCRARISDLDHKLLPNRIVYPMAAYGLLATAVVDTGDLTVHLVAGAGAFAFLLAAVLAYPRGMGMGDVKLAGAMGLFLGLSVVPAMLVAFLSGTVVGLGIMAREGAQARKKAVPFGVFLALGGLVGVLAGPELIELYEDRFLA
jgi:leader peptidase (prepilin peptidase)/N-methyltransferase